MKIIENNNETSKKKRGRPCAIDRYKNDLIQEKFTSMLNNGNTSNDEFTKLKIIPFIAKRHKRQRANNRERSRMQTLNEALIILKQHLPIDLYLKSKTNLQSQTEITENDKQLLKEKSLEFVKMTKIDILKFATEYIKLLTNVLNSNKLFQSPKETISYEYYFKKENSFNSDISNSSSVSMKSLSSSSIESKPGIYEHLPKEKTIMFPNSYQSYYQYDNYYANNFNYYQNNSVCYYN